MGRINKVVFDKEAHKRRGKQVAIQMLLKRRGKQVAIQMLLKRRGKQVAIQMLLKAVCKSLYKCC